MILPQISTAVPATPRKLQGGKNCVKRQPASYFYFISRSPFCSFRFYNFIMAIMLFVWVIMWTRFNAESLVSLTFACYFVVLRSISFFLFLFFVKNIVTRAIYQWTCFCVYMDRRMNIVEKNTASNSELNFFFHCCLKPMHISLQFHFYGAVSTCWSLTRLLLQREILIPANKQKKLNAGCSIFKTVTVAIIFGKMLANRLAANSTL